MRLSYDKCEVYSYHNEDNEDFSPVYSSYHSECDNCKEHKQKVKENLIVGYRIYPKGLFPEKTHKQWEEEWEKFK